MPTSPEPADVVIVGAGAAGLATAVFAARAGVARVVCLEGAKTIGAKILVSGGGRCNVTNRQVSERDFSGSQPRLVKAVLRAFPVARTVEFFAGEGVALHEEERGKLFPDSNRARDVVDALVGAATRAGAQIAAGQRVANLEASDQGFIVTTSTGRTFTAPAVVLATGGRALPKSGSDGFGYSLARQFGHALADTTPALVPLLVEDRVCAVLSGVAVEAEVRVLVEGRLRAACQGPLLFTHFGVSGPAALDASRHWLQARLAGESVAVHISVAPGESFETVDAWLLAQQRERPRALVSTVLGGRLPQAVADAWTQMAGVDGEQTMAHLDREGRRRLVHALTNTVLPVRESRGYTYAEVTAGGVPLDEVDTATMESRHRPGLYLVGEILDVDGRLGGFNFQWAWASAWVAGQALGRRLGVAGPTGG